MAIASSGRGIELCATVRRSGLGVVAILYSGLLSADEEATAAEAGAVVVLKSIRMQALRAALQRIVRAASGGPGTA